MTTFATLCYLRHRGKVLLLRKARGLFGEGRWNAPGGKLRLGELPEKGAVREMLEETGLRVSGMTFHGILNFYLGESKHLDQTVFVFSCDRFSGRLRRGREGRLSWFSVDEMPFDEMWEDDRKWLPMLLDGKRFVGDFYFTENYKALVNYELRETR